MKTIFKQTFPAGLLFAIMLVTNASIACTAVAGGTESIQIKTSANCETCKRTIEKALYATKGVKKAVLNLDDKVVTVKYDAEKTGPEQLRTAIAMSGYDADDMPADEAAHDALPGCCQKDAPKH